jgi:hypothetical protein
MPGTPSSEVEAEVRPYSRLELASATLAMAFAIVAFFFSIVAVAFAAALAAAVSSTLTLARIFLEEVEQRRLR